MKGAHRVAKRIRLPTIQEINPIPEDFDGQYAVRNFLGKTREQITEEFADQGLVLQEDLLFMGCRAFCYDFPAAVDYVVSPAAVGDEIVAALCSVIEFRLQHDAREIADAYPEIVRVADYVLEHYEDFDLTPSIYGDLRPALASIRQQCDRESA